MLRSCGENVKAHLVEDGVFEEHEKIVLEPESVRWVVSELEKFSLMETDKDVIGSAFEVFAERLFVGDKGEFFTPRQVVKMAMEMIDPEPGERILDPACGSGGFLIYALEHVWDKMASSSKYKGPHLDQLQNEFAMKCFYGIDKEIDLVKICKAYMSIIGDGRSNIVKADSLKGIDEWEDKAKNVLTEDGRALKQFDVILTNPPFGSKIKIEHEHILVNYDLGHKWEKDEENNWVKTAKTKHTEPQILFIERCLNLLNNGGRMAIVLPDGIFGNPSDGYIRQWIKSKAEILGIIDCPHNTIHATHTYQDKCIVIEEVGRAPDN